MKQIYKTPTRPYCKIYRPFIFIAVAIGGLLTSQMASANPFDHTTEAPQISVTQLTNTSSTSNRTVQATISAGTGISSAALYYRVDGGAWFTAPSSNSGNNYNFTLAGQPAGTTVEYFVAARSGTDSSTAPANVGQQTAYGLFYEYSILCPASQNRQLAFQGFETGPLANSWTYTRSCVTGCTSFDQFSKVSNANPATDIPASSRIKSGAYSYQHQSNGSIAASLVFNTVQIPAGATNIRITVRVASLASSNGGGADADDYVKLWAAVNNNNFPNNADITLNGTNNIRYGFGATGIVSTSAGTAVSYTPSAGNDQFVNGRSTLQISLPNNSQSAALKIELRNNDNSNREIWAIDDIEITADIPASSGRYFKTIKNGAWDAPFTWAVANTANGTFIPTCTVPNFSNSDAIEISNGDTIIIKKNLIGADAIDQLSILETGYLRLDDHRLQIVNSVSGKADMQLAGMFHDRTNLSAVEFLNGANWQMINTATYKKCGSSEVTGWRDHYLGGMQQMPATAYWEYCFDGVDEIGVLTEGMVYPHLSFQNMSGNSMYEFRPLTGAGSTAVVKGNLSIGNRAIGSAPVKVYLNNIYTDPLLADGNIFVDSLSSFTNVAYNGIVSNDRGNGTGISLNGNLHVKGNFNMSGDTAATGILNITGTGVQLADGSGNIVLHDAAIDNRNGGKFEVHNDINVYGKLSFASNQSKLFLYEGNIYLKSSAARTANVGIIPNGVVINYQDTGRFVVERYIGTTRKWQLLSVPVNGTGTVRQNWQEAGMTAAALPGYGVNITGPTAPAGGLDNYSINYSLKTYIPGDDINAEGTYDPIENTDTTLLQNPYGYFLYVYGDRSVTSGGNAGPATVLRSTGKLFVGNDVVNDQPTVGNGNQDRYMSIGNPFASAIDFTKLKLHSSIDDEFYLWDPKMEGDYTAGAFVAFSASTNPPYMPVPWLGIPPQPTNEPSPSFPAPNTRIESGQAFFVYKTGNGNAFIKFEEDDKIDGSRNVNRNPIASEDRGPQNIRDRAQFNMSLHASLNGQSRLLDGNAVVWSNEFRSSETRGDMRKMWNQSDNFAIIGNDAKELVVDTRANFNQADTVRLLMFGQFYQDYHFRFSQINMPAGTKAWIVDQYLATQREIDLRDTSTYSFTVDGNPASMAQNRFYIVFAAKARIQGQQEVLRADALTATAFPNPATSTGFSVRVNAPVANEKYNIQLINSDGKLIYTSQFISNPQTTVIQIKPAAGLQAGYYKVLISNGKYSVTLNQLVVD
jgi:hypothetical protein